MFQPVPHLEAPRRHRQRSRRSGAALVSVVAGLVAASLAGPTLAQSNSLPTSLGGLVPATSKGYLGLGLGRSGFDPDCVPGFGCDENDRVLKLTAGAVTNEIWGAEFGLIDFGKAQSAGGELKARGLSLAGTANFEFGAGFTAIAKLGVTYARTRTSASPLVDIATGSKNSLGLNWGLGASWAFDPKWAVVAEWEQYRLKFAPGTQTVSVLSVGVRYLF